LLSYTSHIYSYHTATLRLELEVELVLDSEDTELDWLDSERLEELSDDLLTLRLELSEETQLEDSEETELLLVDKLDDSLDAQELLL